MSLGIISFTSRGRKQAERLNRLLREAGYDCRDDSGRKAADWAGEMFREGRSMIFVGAAGIAVRSIAPWLKDKFRDPAVVVMDEAGRFVIPILSGHAGGANDLARVIGTLAGAVPVITTATDVNQVFSVDVFAVLNGLQISDRVRAKEIAMALLEKEPVGFFSEFPIVAENEKETDWIPKGCCREKAEKNIRITVKERESDWAEEDLILRPRALCLGVGCRRGIETKRLKDTVFQALAKANLSPAAVKTLATIDLKFDEQAIRELAEERGWELRFFSAEELNAVQGSFSGSDFVQKTVGVDNVCERAALAALPGGRLVMEKKAENGVTAAAAVGKVRIAAGGPRQVPGIIAHKGPKDGP